MKRNTLITTTIFNTDTKVAKLVDGYTAGKSMGILAAIFGTTQASVRKALVANGVKIRGRGRVKGVSPARLAD
jgi:hypothetical protein